MATTIVPEPGPIDPNLDPAEVLKQVHEDLRIAQGDLDKAGDVEDAQFYAGLYEAYSNVRDLLTGARAVTGKSPEQQAVNVLEAHLTKPEPCIRLIADYQMMGDLDGLEWAEQVFSKAKGAGLINDYNVTGSHAGAWGLQFITFTVDVAFDGKEFVPEMDAQMAGEAGKSLLNSIVGDSDVEVRWACGVNV